MPRYFIIHKPFQVLSQFSSSATDAAGDRKKTLKDFFQVPKDVYPVGRLDYDSEGLLILTNDVRLNHRLLHPSFAHEREYWVQVEGNVNDAALKQLASGVEIGVNGKPYQSRLCLAERFDNVPDVSTRNPPVRFRKMIPTSWIRLVVTEGKNRQVRKMTARVGLPTLRLIRYRIQGLTLNGLNPGDMREVENKLMHRLLFEV